MSSSRCKQLQSPKEKEKSNEIVQSVSNSIDFKGKTKVDLSKILMYNPKPWGHKLNDRTTPMIRSYEFTQ